MKDTSLSTGLNTEMTFTYILYRFGPSIIGFAFFMGFVALSYFGEWHLYNALLKALGIVPYSYPFVDLESILKAIDCSRSGINVFVPNSCMNGGVYSYSPALLQARHLPIGVEDRIIGGFLIDIAFFVSLSWLPVPRTRTEFYLRLGAVLSTDAVFALERANLDLLIFVLALIGIVFSCRRTFLRMFGYAIFVLVALLKFYPAMLLILVARERLSLLLALTGSMLTIGIVFLLRFGHTSAAAVQAIPHGQPFSEAFGAINLPLGISFLISLPSSTEGFETFHLPLAAELSSIFMFLIAVALAVRLAYQDYTKTQPLHDLPLAFVIAGAAIIVGCFFMAQNIGYRGIFLFFTLPGLYTMMLASSGVQRVGLRRLIAYILFLMWEECFRHALVHFLPNSGLVVIFWLGRELVWWWVVIRFMAILVAYLLSALAKLKGALLERTAEVS